MKVVKKKEVVKKGQKVKTKKPKDHIIKSGITELLANDMMAYGLATIERAIPTIQDTMTISNRRTLQIAINYLTLCKSSRIVGDILGKLHPHGDSSVYGTMCTLVNANMPLLRGHGNFGDVMYDDTGPAAHRYTECSISKIGLAVIDKEVFPVVPTNPTYDDKSTELLFLPVKVPVGLINGTNGVGYGFANKVPSHPPLGIVNAMIKLLKSNNMEISKAEINSAIGMPYRRGFDGTFSKRPNLYVTLANNVMCTAHCTVAKGSYGGTTIVIDSVPVGTTISSIITKIKKLHNSYDGSPLTSLSDQSSNKCIHIEMKIKRGADHKVFMDMLKAKGIIQNRVRYTPVYYDITEEVGVPKKYSIHDLLASFLLSRVEWKGKAVDYKLNELADRIILLKIRKKIITDKKVFDKLIFTAKDTKDALKRISVTYTCSTEIASKVLDTSYRIGINKAQSITEEINKLKETIVEYKGYKKDIPAYLIKELEAFKLVIRKEYRPIKKKRGV